MSAGVLMLVQKKERALQQRDERAAKARRAAEAELRKKQEWDEGAPARAREREYRNRRREYAQWCAERSAWLNAPMPEYMQ